VIPELGEGEVQVWRATLPASDAWLDLLSDGEREARHRFRLERDRAMYVLSHALRRAVLGAHAGAAPSALRFTTGEHGKPALAGAPDLRFNVSHSGDVALLAVARGREVGVDVEQERPLADWEVVARRAFSPLEQLAILRLPPPAREAAFYACWSRKEAVIKALGFGLAFPLDVFEVEVDPARPPRLLASRDARLAVDAWTMAPLDAGPGHAAALMVAGAGVTVRELGWPAG
jgi:4'-phosphopantetheinyl transferase